MKTASAQPTAIIWLLCLLIAFFFVFILVVKIDEAVMAPGRIVSDRPQYSVQSVDGGVVRDIMVAEGKLVNEGDVLMVLEDTRPLADVQGIQSQIGFKEVQRARLVAQTSDSESFQFVASVMNPLIYDTQRRIFDIELNQLNDEIAYAEKRFAALESEFRRVETLFDNGSAALREYNEGLLRMQEAEAAMAQVRIDFRLRHLSELSEIELELESLQANLSTREDRLLAVTVRAPASGIVNELVVRNNGAVVSPGGELLRITSADSLGMVEADIALIDAPHLNIGQEVTVEVSAFNSSIYGRLEGKLVYLSAGTITQTQNGAQRQFYRARIQLNEIQSAFNGQLDQLRIGLDCTVRVRTGERSIFAFLMKPVLRGFDGALVIR